MNYSKFFQQRYFSQGVALLLLLLLLALGAVPGYLTGRWQWQQPLPVTNLKQLRQIRQTGLTLPNWQTIEQAQQQIGEHKWSSQVLQKQGANTQVLLLLLPQNGPKNQPQVEWTDIDSWGRLRWGQWNQAQNRSVKFTLKHPQENALTTETKVTASFFRAVTREQTFAVLQWYAWRNGGDSSPLQWLLADQVAQLQKQRAAWVAVSILMPMEPLGQIETVWPEVKSIGETVQAALMAGFL
ncbi:cyanoexosortase B system-associated protein [Chlorogloeopsis sp. ULAP01]|uniref:cyanoexosortase B system-associated protein n=1 Tax=Chlorogloeopsis sp. ULAP01 TaxID=3056483 RepID=UPI0025AB3EB8|nr:cyanoexosortase B system-associated protein [Chlorogloeopsis sp. ULAP01]MDM9381337.1 cyanoexosortase B system-associated protein [Chlorogloeopsis sp. ULAP01]